MPTVLVLDCYAPTLATMCRNLSPIPGIKTYGAGSAKEAVAHINSHGGEIDAAILNPHGLPPGEDVYQVISALRGQRGSDVKISIICHEDELEDRDGLGEIHFLPWIPTPEEFRAAV